MPLADKVFVFTRRQDVELIFFQRKFLVSAGSMIAVGFAAVLFALFYPTKIHIVSKTQDLDACVTPPPVEDHFVGLALSGGGSRASVFAAAGISELQRLGVLASVTHVSSVSGGGLPAAYLATNAMGQCTPAKTQGYAQGTARNAECSPATFDAMRDSMTRDYSREMWNRQVLRPNRWLHPSERVTSLEEAFSDVITSGATLAGLPARPVFLFNTVSYNTGDTFVMSNAPLPHRADAPKTLLEPRLRTASFSDTGCTRRLPADTPVALAVAASAAFPPLYGPVTISQPSASGTAFFHLGDGGLSENTGVDTLLEAALDASARNPAIPRLTLISFDAGLKIDAFRSRATHDLRLWSSSELTRLVDVPNLRGDRYRNVIEEQIIAASPVPIDIIRLMYLDADISWHEACPAKTRAAHPTMRAYLASIPTGFSITTCDTEMLRLAARALIKEAMGKGRPLARLVETAAMQPEE